VQESLRVYKIWIDEAERAVEAASSEVLQRRCGFSNLTRIRRPPDYTAFPKFVTITGLEQVGSAINTWLDKRYVGNIELVVQRAGWSIATINSNERRGLGLR
jgi:hypothetical protein